MTRPEPTFPPVAGHHFEAAREDPKQWRAIAPDLARPCRQTKDGQPKGSRRTCKAPSVAAINRTRGRQNWWHYCAEHLYGRWVENTEDGPAVFYWRLMEDTPKAADE